MTKGQNVKKGGIAVETNNIFPVIKKWLYSEKDIFLREVVSNASDAITKLKRLISLNEISENIAVDPFKITVTCDSNAGTLTVSDNGIGMTEEELEKYICNIALSGALDFIQKYEGQDNTAGAGIIGHFGLGFYSAFMVADKVEIITKSYKDSPAIHWICNDSGEYEMQSAERTTCGTDVIMHINKDEDFTETSKVRAILDKYCAFMPIEIYLEDVQENDKDKSDTAIPINDVEPLWQKKPSDCSDEDYKNFYHKVFNDIHDPLFWIHINADYPLNFKGILYFPKIRNEYESLEGQVKLYYNQVFVADNIKEVIPEYLLMLKGCLDCPELPLNVSRSYLQTNSYVLKVSAHIVKKVADKLNYMIANEREKYEKVWEDIRTFVEYACLRDHKFFERTKNSLLLPLTDERFMTLSEYIDNAKKSDENHAEAKIYYTTDRSMQSPYISLLCNKGINVALMEHMIDTQFIAMLEHENENVKCLRVDADVTEALCEEKDSDTNEELAELFKKVSGNVNIMIKFCALTDDRVPALLNVTEDSRRMSEIMKLYSSNNSNLDGIDSYEMTLVVNTSSRLVEKLNTLVASDDSECLSKAEKIASYIYKLSLLSQRKMSAEEMNVFMFDSFDILSLI